MTINLSDNNPRANYTATSGQTAFTIPFDYFDDGDISVYQNGTLKTITTHYTLSGSTMTLVTGATAGDKIAITRDVPLERTTDLTSTYSASSINNQLDTIVAQIADLDDRVSRSISLNDYEVAVSLDLPATADRLGKTIQFNSSTGALEVGPSGDELTSIASIASEITALDGISANITAVAGAISNVNSVGSNISSVTSVAGSISNINTVNTNIANVNLVGASIADVNDVADSIDQVELVAGSISNVDTVALANTNIGTVAGDISNINTVAGISSNITTVAGITAAISTVNSNAADITTVSNNIDDVNDVANVITKVTTVADNISNVNTVAPEVQYLSDVANNISTISTVAQNISDIQGAITAAANAATSESNAATSETNAATSAGNAATSESNAAASASSASSAQTSAESARDATLAAFDSFDDRYLGAKTADPSLDNDGNALVGGALYYNSVDEVMKVYTGSAWVAAYASLSGALLVSNNLSDLNNAASARTNLGLGSAATSAATDFVSVTGDSITGNLSFGDNDKAIFGAGSDLQIYHDGTHSYVKDNGTGDLILQASDDLKIQTTSGTNMAVFTEGTYARLFYNGSAKFETTATGIDVTGTVTAASGYFQGSNSFINDTMTLNFAAPNGQIAVKNSTGSPAANLYMYTTDTSGNTNLRQSIGYNGDISFYEDTGTTPKFFWDASAESLGIGTSSPSLGSNGSGLHIKGASGDYGVLKVDSSTTSEEGWVQFSNNGVDKFRIASDSSTNLKFIQSGVAERMRIDSSGNVGIGTSSPDQTLHVEKSVAGGGVELLVGNSGANQSGTYSQIGLGTGGDSTGTAYFRLYRDGSGISELGGYTTQTFHTNATERMRIDSSGNVGIGTSSPSAELHIEKNSADAAVRLVRTGYGYTELIGSTGGSGNDFKINLNGTDRFHIQNSTGNVGIGTSSPQRDLHITNATSAEIALTDSGAGRTHSIVSDGTMISLRSDMSYNNIVGIDGANNAFLVRTNASEKMRVDSVGSLLLYGTGTGDQRIEIGANTTGNHHSYIDLIGDTTYSDYGLRLLRGGGGPNTYSSLYHRGTGDFAVNAIDAAPLVFLTSNTERIRIDSSGNVGIGTSSPTGNLTVYENITSPANYYDGLQVEIKADNGTAGIGLHRSGYGHVGIYTDQTNRLSFNMSNGTVHMYQDVGNVYGSGNSHPSKQWVNFNGQGTVAIRSSWNTSSITDNGTGQYTINMSTAFSDTGYSISANATWNVGVSDVTNVNIDGETSTKPTSSTFKIGVFRTNDNANYDAEFVYTTAHGNR